jgi:photosystem II stability/assembly factor-like uncharacterized protein
MKKVFLLALFVFSLNYSNAQWKAYSLPEQNFPTWQLQNINNILIASGNHGVYSSSDEGANWTKIYSGSLATVSSAMRKMWNKDNHIYIRLDDGFLYTLLSSDDGGSTWYEDTLNISPDLRKNSAFDAFFIAGDTLYTQTVGRNSSFQPVPHYWKKKIGETAWAEFKEFNSALFITFPDYILTLGSSIYMSSFGQLYRSDDNGKTYTLLFNYNPDFPNIGKMGIIGNDIYSYGNLPNDSVFVVSTDKGLTWNKKTTFPKIFANGYINFGKDNKIFAVAPNGQTSQSIDGGTSWSELSPSQNLAILDLVEINGKYLATTFNKDSVLIFGSSSSSVEKQSQAEQLTIYPNPSSDIIMFATQIEDQSQVKIYNSLGELVDSQTVSNNSIAVAQLSSGIYMLEVQNKTNKAIQKLRFIKK